MPSRRHHGVSRGRAQQGMTIYDGDLGIKESSSGPPFGASNSQVSGALPAL